MDYTGTGKNLAGAFHFTETTVRQIEHVAHESVHAAAVIHRTLDLTAMDQWEENLAIATGAITRAIFAKVKQ